MPHKKTFTGKAASDIQVATRFIRPGFDYL